MLGDGVCSNAAVRRVFRDRIHALGVTYSTVDGIAGLADGYAAKVLSEPPAREMGTDAMWALAGALGIWFVPIVDHERTKAVRGRWVKRQRAPTSNPAPECVVADRHLGDVVVNNGDGDGKTTHQCTP
jgi:hypothetical protein